MVTIAWVGVRVAMLWPRTGSLPAAIEAASPSARAEPRIAPTAASPPRTADARPPLRMLAPPPRYRAPLGDEH
ncbi:hypothetical protein ACX0FC_17675, partial [Enterococcus faecium]